MANEMLFGVFIAERRKFLGLTQGQVAGRAHFNQDYLSRIERGERIISPGLLGHLYKALEMTEALRVRATAKYADLREVKPESLEGCSELAWLEIKYYDGSPTDRKNRRDHSAALRRITGNLVA